MGVDAGGFVDLGDRDRLARRVRERDLAGAEDDRRNAGVAGEERPVGPGRESRELADLAADLAPRGLRRQRERRLGGR